MNIKVGDKVKDSMHASVVSTVEAVFPKKAFIDMERSERYIITHDTDGFLVVLDEQEAEARLIPLYSELRGEEIEVKLKGRTYKAIIQ